MIKRIEWLLFKILILGELTDDITTTSWKRSPQQIFVVEYSLMETSDTNQYQVSCNFYSCHIFDCIIYFTKSADKFTIIIFSTN